MSIELSNRTFITVHINFFHKSTIITRFQLGTKWIQECRSDLIVSISKNIILANEIFLGSFFNYLYVKLTS